MATLLGGRFAHRGLHTAKRTENGLPAFDAAVMAGHGIECDVRLSRDGVPFVFHDSALDRLTRYSGPIGATSAAMLDQLVLTDGSPLPRLSTVLGHINGATPLLLEAKAERWRDGAPIARAIVQTLKSYSGPVGVMSFNPLVPRYLARHAPWIVRGLVVSESHPPAPVSLLAQGKAGRIRRTLDISTARPDFLAYDIRDLPSAEAAHHRSKGVTVLSWTVRTNHEWARCYACADAAIFESADNGG